jgi:hypothetical protein
LPTDLNEGIAEFLNTRLQSVRCGSGVVVSDRLAIFAQCPIAAVDAGYESCFNDARENQDGLGLDMILFLSVGDEKS